MEKSSEATMRILNEYRPFCLRVAVASFFVIVTWIWKNNESAFSRCCNELASILLIFVYISIFYNLDYDMCHSVFHILFFCACLWHGLLSLLNKDSIAVCPEVMNGESRFESLWCFDAYWWVLTRDSPMIVISVGASIVAKYLQLFNDFFFFFALL
ncbi:unnamed protein product [Rotaria magnacalcarata]